MVFNTAHLTVTVGGKAFVNERWSVGTRVKAGAETAALADLTTFVDALDDDTGEAIFDLWSADGLRPWSTAHDLDTVRIAAVGVDGKMAPGASPYLYEPTPLAGGLSPAPAQLALCTTHLTAAVRGRASKGRAYWPYGALAPNSTGDVGSGARDGLAASVAAYMQLINDDFGGTTASAFDLRCAVFSNLDAGVWRAITGITVGSVLDTQRRRRNQLSETYNTPVAVTA